MNDIKTAVEALTEYHGESPCTHEKIRLMQIRRDGKSDRHQCKGCEALAALRAMEGQTAPQPASPIPTVSFDDLHKAVASIVDGEEMWSAYDVACAIHALLTACLKGADHD